MPTTLPPANAFTVEEFIARPVREGAFVFTPASRHRSLAWANGRLRRIKYWVWQVLRIYQPGNPLPPNSWTQATSDEVLFEAQLYAPKGLTPHHPFIPLWDLMAVSQFLRTDAERREHRHGPAPDGEKIRAPLVGMLRQVNLMGGGFALTGSNRLPKVAHMFLEQQTSTE